MPEVIEYSTTRTWLDRVRPDFGDENVAASGPPAASSKSADTSQGWDPYDVWLRRVHLPRSRGAKTW